MNLKNISGKAKTVETEKSSLHEAPGSFHTQASHQKKKKERKELTGWRA